MDREVVFMSGWTPGLDKFTKQFVQSTKALANKAWHKNVLPTFLAEIRLYIFSIYYASKKLLIFLAQEQPGDK